MTGYIIKSKDMDEWTEICKTFAKKMNAKLLFVNETSCGLEFSDGKFWHYSVEDMIDTLEDK